MLQPTYVCLSISWLSSQLAHFCPEGLYAQAPYFWAPELDAKHCTARQEKGSPSNTQAGILTLLSSLPLATKLTNYNIDHNRSQLTSTQPPLLPGNQAV